mmetsp:Transcript_27860/g.58975  ORF Transcript_27860/g.58975 Transcript_27860/m.58975 type:complete len:243 (+) Transcript_27860:81-809(+)
MCAKQQPVPPPLEAEPGELIDPEDPRECQEQTGHTYLSAAQYAPRHEGREGKHQRASEERADQRYEVGHPGRAQRHTKCCGQTDRGHWHPHYGGVIEAPSALRSPPDSLQDVEKGLHRRKYIYRASEDQGHGEERPARYHEEISQIVVGQEVLMDVIQEGKVTADSDGQVDSTEQHRVCANHLAGTPLVGHLQPQGDLRRIGVVHECEADNREHLQGVPIHVHLGQGRPQGLARAHEAARCL